MPAVPGVFPIVATLAFEEVQNVEAVTSWLVPFKKPAEAENGVVCPCRTEVVAGLTVSETIPPGATLSCAVAVRLPEVAVIVVVPRLTPVARPWLPAALLMVATALFDELQVTTPVTSAVLASLKTPLAANWKVLVGVQAAHRQQIEDGQRSGRTERRFRNLRDVPNRIVNVSDDIPARVNNRHQLPEFVVIGLQRSGTLRIQIRERRGTE
jgi:hypothetical protein